ncbi:alpha/beta hydrolase [Pengzhenrongella sp.]|jgi:pimeloyl-ACP methyl ester carboxylesterase|uniref:alpha/beta hydrolase n=1 Tax=Pengzhenrongella sp. TaxID=2888820 RepID=UPI002F957818
MVQAPANLVFIHGMYMTGSSWNAWAERAAARGYLTHTPSWPFHRGEPADLRANIDPGLGALTFADVTGALKGFLDGFPERPILIGHSIGGLLVQKLVNDGYAAAGVAISSAPPRGIVFFDPHFFRANFPHVNPLAGNRPVVMTPERFHYTFANTMSVPDSNAAFEQLVVPESRNVPRSTLTRQARIDFGAPHVPLLFLAGDRDHLTPASMIRKNVDAYRAPGSVLDYRAFPNRSHLVCNQDGWEEVADHALDWVRARVHGA